MQPHLPIELLVDHVRGVGSDNERAVVMLHISECEECANLAERLTELASTAKADVGFAVPDTVVNNAIAIFAHGQTKQHRGSEVARLVFDSAGSLKALNGDVDVSTPRNLFFEAADAGFRLEVTRSGSGVSVSGLITAKSVEHATLATVLAVRDWDGPVIARAVCNQEGEFALEYEAPVAVLLHVSSLTWRRPIAVPVDAEIANYEAVTKWAT